MRLPALAVPLLLILAVPGVSAQAPAPAAPAAQPPTPPSGYAYTPSGRRDPFVSLVNRGTTGTVRTGAPADGVGGLTTDEVVVRGIVQSRGAWVAMVTGAAGKVFTVRAGERLADGVIRSIEPQFLVIQQQVNDPLSLEKQRDVRKYLRGGEQK